MQSTWKLRNHKLQNQKPRHNKRQTSLSCNNHHVPNWIRRLRWQKKRYYIVLNLSPPPRKDENIFAVWKKEKTAASLQFFFKNVWVKQTEAEELVLSTRADNLPTIRRFVKESTRLSAASGYCYLRQRNSSLQSPPIPKQRLLHNHGKEQCHQRTFKSCLLEFVFTNYCTSKYDVCRCSEEEGDVLRRRNLLRV